MGKDIEKVKSQFGINDTFAVKGIAILMMYIHHMFLSPERWGKSFVDFWPLTQNIVVSMSVYFKICVALFIFLSAYGLTVKYRQVAEKNNNNIGKFIFNSWYKLEMNFLFIFILAWIYGYAMNLANFSKVYGKGSQYIFKIIIDGLGLANLFGTNTYNDTWWYMSLAVVIIVIFPVLFDFYKKYGVFAVLSLSVILPIAFRLPYSDLKRWLPCMILGIVFADRDLLPYIRYKLLVNSKIRNFLGSFIILILTVYITKVLNPMHKGIFVPITTGLSVMAIIIFAYTYLRQKYIWGGLIFLGKHSMNMFFIHTFIRHYWYHDFIYGFKYAWVDTFILLVITVLLSICIEYLKKILGYNKLLFIK